MKAAHAAIYLAATLLVAGPMLAPGFVFALDHAMGPHAAAYYARYLVANDDPIQNKGAYGALLLALAFAMPAWLAQKLLLFAPFFVAGIGAHVLASRRVPERVALLAGLVYLLSPFAYIRGVAGQTGVLWAYALAPGFLAAWLRALEGSRRAFALAALLAFATGVFQAHGLVLLAFLVALLALVRLARAPRAWKAEVGRPAALALALLLVNAAWIVPVLLAPQTTLDRIGLADRGYFATTSSGMPSVGVAALTLQGFWRPGYEGPYDGHPWLLVVPAAILLLAVHGFRAKRDEMAIALAVAGVAGFALAVGSASPATAPLWSAAWDHVPLLKGFRDSQKFLALLALAYADLAAAGAADLLARLRAPRLPRAAPVVALALLLALPVATATPLLGGYDGQLGVASYPTQWQVAEDATRACTGSMLVLPWHLYLDESWLPNADKRVTNPAKMFFTCPVVSSDDVEAGGAAGKEGSPLDAYAAFWMRDMGMATTNPHGIRTFGNILAAANIQYVLVLKDADWKPAAQILAQQRDLALVVDDARVQVWRNLVASAPVRVATEVVPLASWADLANLSATRPLADLAFAPAGTVTGAGPWTVATPSPAQPAAGWRLAGQAPRWDSLGISPAFAGAPAGAVPAPTASLRTEAALWVLSSLTFVSLVALASSARLPRIRRREQPSITPDDKLGEG